MTMVGARRVTLGDVATASGVSPATVSFVLNDDPHQTISPTTSERVRQAAGDLGYVPHGMALRRLSRIVVLNVGWGLEGNYTRSYIRGLDDELAAHDHVLLVRHGHGAPRSTQRFLDTIAPRAELRIAAHLTGHEPGAAGDWRAGFAANAALHMRHLAAGHTHLAMALPDQDSPLLEVRPHRPRAIRPDAGGRPAHPMRPDVDYAARR